VCVLATVLGTTWNRALHVLCTTQPEHAWRLTTVSLGKEWECGLYTVTITEAEALRTWLTAHPLSYIQACITYCIPSTLYLSDNPLAISAPSAKDCMYLSLCQHSMLHCPTMGFPC
jgi:hypothetical protein